MTDAKFVCAAQLNSTHSIVNRLRLDGVMEIVRRAAETAQLDILIAGGEEIPELYGALTQTRERAAPQVFLWYATLADNPALQPDHRVVNYRGEVSLGWGGSATGEDVGETFSFACPNNPAVREAVTARLERLLTEYPFDGVFLDKFRFPSPANGLPEILSCFCPYCQSAAASAGLDLGEVQAWLTRIAAGGGKTGGPGIAPSPESGWLQTLIGGLSEQDQALVTAALRFRARSITQLVEEIRALTGRMGKQMALDLFSPGLAYLVGQDYPALARLAAWVKPMSYRYANGPAGLRLEIPQLVRGLEQLLRLAPGRAEDWLQAHAAGMAGSSLAAIERDGAPSALIASETRQAVERAGTTPVYMGIEAVSIPAFNIHTTPSHVREMLSIARETGARGAVLSWDILHMPEDNLLAVRGG